ncbi:spc97 spc98 family protein [Ophiostoma piceae UAMH 11346]|uniref:Spindle pole body component n=1 Tax=Ophiostoma piceae (strain UAMH 11346) TaxID=1262450 RepID=S3CY09_OPHP1|nr:spc97 spc98 family protein [Ophiostoma piceae UAMH 11346]
MAFLSELTAQTDELVTAVTSISTENDVHAFGSLREATLRSLRHHNNLRTNQFEVEAQLQGLEERFSVAGREGLSDALRDCRSKLSDNTTKWTPDILHFLLELSDRPAESASLDDLEALRTSRISAESPPLRWEDISREDDWASEPALWHSNDYGDTSGDELDYDYDNDDYDDDHDDEDGQDKASEDTTMSSINTPDQQARTHRDLVSDEHTREELAALLTSVRESQAWRGTWPVRDAPASGDGKLLIAELQIVRESLFMLQGLNTTLFGSNCTLVDSFRLSNVSLEAHRSLLTFVAASGRRLMPLRKRISPSQPKSSVPLLQVFQEAIRRRLHTFDHELSDMHARFVDIQSDVLVSTVAVIEELRPSLLCLFALSVVVQKLESERNMHAFRYLEILFDAASVAQFEGEQALYEFLGTIFFECFQVYLRPIRLWMEEGKLLDGDKIFFVAGAPAQVPLNQIWQNQYKLLRTSAGTLHAPRFLQPAASKIFTTGKSIVVLRHLGKYDNRNAGVLASAAIVEPTLDFAHVCPPGAAMAPFAQLFDEAFEGWIQSKHHAASATLQATLFDACGLWASLDALHCVYLMADGAATDAFASRVFHSLDTRNPRWHDRYAMTEFAREAFAERLDAYRLSIALDKGDMRDSDDPVVARRSIRQGFARIRLSYRLSWPVQIIIPGDSISGYQKLFTLLLQIRRTSSLLSGHRLLDDGIDVRADAEEGRNRKTGQPSKLPTGDRALYFTLRTRLLWFCNTLQSYIVTLVIAPRIDGLRADLKRAVDVDAMIEVHAQFLKALVTEACLGEKLGPIRDAILDLLDLALRLEDAHRANAAREASELQETWRLSVLSSPFQTPSKKLAASAALASGASPGSVRRRLFLAATTPRRRSEEQYDDDYNYGEEDNKGDDYEYHGGTDGDDDGGVDDDHDNKGGDGGDEGGDESSFMIPHYASRRDRQPVSAGASVRQSYSETLRTISSDLANSLRFVTGGLRAVARASSDATAAAKWDMLAEMLGDGSRRADMTR